MSRVSIDHTDIHSYRDDRHEDAQIKISHQYNTSFNGHDDEDSNNGGGEQPTSDKPLTRRLHTNDTDDINNNHELIDITNNNQLPPQSVKTGWNTSNNDSSNHQLQNNNNNSVQPNAIKYGRRQHQSIPQQQYNDTIDDNQYNDNMVISNNDIMNTGLIDTYVNVQQQPLTGYSELNSQSSQLSHTINNIDISILLTTVQPSTNDRTHCMESDQQWDHDTLFSSISELYSTLNTQQSSQSYIDTQTLPA